MGQNIQPKDLLAERASPENGFVANEYLVRPRLDGELEKAFNQKKRVLLVGKPLGGKSRAVYDNSSLIIVCAIC